MADAELEKRPDGVALITLNRPEVMNALGGQIVTLFNEHLEECRQDPAVRCIAVTGAGRGWCAGGDIRGMQTQARRDVSANPADRVSQTWEESLHGMDSLHQAMVVPLYRIPKPTVALINGAAAGGGMGLALAFDIRVLSDKARFVSAFKDVGQSGDCGISYGLERLLGRSQALEILYLSESIDADRALKLGLANHVFPHDEFLEKGLEYCARLAAGPTAVYARMKQNVTFAETHQVGDVLDLETIHWKASQMGEDHRNAVEAFMEKRKPNFVGR